jgi:DNA modification methylase
MNFTIHLGDNVTTLKTFEDNSIDAIVCDPPYGISFLGKDWDSKKATETTSQMAALHNLPSGMKHTSLADDLAFQDWMRGVFSECLRVLKPGGYLLAFSAARTYHHMAMAAQTAGFEVRDQLMWIYSSGFPKAQDIGKGIQKRKGVEETKPLESNGPANGMARMTHNQSDPAKYAQTKEALDIVLTDSEAQQWAGWKTSLKPAHEPICMARKPFKDTTIDNVLKWGVGALNIDASRIPTDDKMIGANHVDISTAWSENTTKERVYDELWQQHAQGRFPSNVLGEIEGYQKFFYCPKVSRKERHIGFDAPPDPLANYAQGDVKNHPLWDPSIGTNIQRLKHKILEHNKDLGKQTAEQTAEQTTAGNNHPTVKPVALMRYLIQLVTPPNSVVLDPFCGSGSTGMAAVELGHTFIGCELDPNYVKIAETRIVAWNTPDDSGTKFEELFE